MDRKIDYLRISLTDQCQLHCAYCRRDKNIPLKPKQDILTLEDIYKTVSVFTTHGINKVRLSGGEPLMRRNITWLIDKLSQLNLEKLALTTNGLLLDKYYENLVNSNVTHINISLDSLDKRKYRLITGVDGQGIVIDAIKKYLKTNIKIKVNVVVIKDFNDNEIDDFIEFALEHGVDLRFIEVMPIGEMALWSKERFVNLSLKEKTFILKYDVRRISKDEKIARYYTVGDSKTKIGWITPVSNPFCTMCNRLRLTSEGRIKLCLHSNDEYDLSKFVDDKQKLDDYINKIMIYKENDIRDNVKFICTKNMNMIGG